jgi:prevent-host-death family protein
MPLEASTAPHHRATAPGAPGPSSQKDTNYDQSDILVMKKVAAAKFKAECLSLLDDLEPDGIVVTKHGRPIARVLPAERASAHLIGALRGRIRVRGSILSTGVKWDAGG